MAKNREETKVENIEEELIPNHTRKESILIIASSIFAIISFFFINYSGIKFTYLLTPISSFNGLVNNEININYIFLILGAFFLALSLSGTVLFSLVKERKKIFLFILPPIVGISSMFFFGILIGLGILLSYFIIEYLVSKDKNIFKKISINYLVNHSVGRALFVINISIALAVMFALVNNTNYAKTEMNQIMISAVGEDITIDNLNEKLLEQQKNTSLIFSNSVIDSIETAFAEEPMCRNAMINNRQNINNQISKDIDRQLALQQDKFDKITQMINLILTYYPYMTAITLFAILQLCNVFILFLAKTSTILLYKFLRRAFGFSIN